MRSFELIFLTKQANKMKTKRQSDNDDTEIVKTKTAGKFISSMEQPT